MGERRGGFVTDWLGRQLGEHPEVWRENAMKSSSKPNTGRVISIISPMGGDGRTTLCANVSAALATLGKRTIAVDAGMVQGQLGMAMGLENRIAFSLVDVMEEACDLSEACIRHRDIPGLKFLPIARHLRDMAVMENVKPHPEIIRRAYDELRSLSDFVFIDSPPGYTGQLATTTATDEVIVVVMPWWHTVRTAERLIDSVKLRGKCNMRLVINHMRSEKGQHREDMPNANEILEILQLNLLGIVPEDDYVAACSHRGKFAAQNPGSPAGQEYQNVARRLLGEKVPFTTFKN